MMEGENDDITRTAILQPSDNVKALGRSIINECVEMKIRYNPINLGTGFPDYPAPPDAQQALIDAVSSNSPMMHQYTGYIGHPRLLKVLSKIYSRHFEHQVDPERNVLITPGAMQSLTTIMTSYLNPGDEVILIEPFFVSYPNILTILGAVPVYVTLRAKGFGNENDIPVNSSDFTLNRDELRKAFSPKTKMILLNTPQNPLGKVFKQEELEMIAEECRTHNIICVSDEVYEWLTYPGGKEHFRIATLPGMWERTLTVGSAGKTFNVTGWKTGWTIGPEHLLRYLKLVHVEMTRTCVTPIQEAIAVTFEKELARIESGKTESSYFKQIQRLLVKKRDKIHHVLMESGMRSIMPEAGYFIVADFSKLYNPDEISGDNSEPKDVRFLKWMIVNKKLFAIPMSLFYSEKNRHLGENMLRFCFFKQDETLEEAGDILRNWKQ